MSWIQENKFTAALAGVTLVGSVALITLTSQKSGELEDATSKLKKALKTEAKIQSSKPYPNKQNLEAKKQNVSEYAESALKLQEEFMAYRPEAGSLADLAPEGFSEMVSGYRNRLDAQFKAQSVQLPAGCVYGFKAYSSKFPLPGATGELHYQMKALEWLFTELANNQPEALLNVVRPKLDVETGVEAPAPKRRSSKKSKKAKLGEPEYDKMPIQVSFRCSESQLNSFLEGIANSKEYYFAVRAIRVQNERLVAPSAGDAKFETKDVADGFGGGFDDFVDDAAEGAVEEAVVEMQKVASDSDDTRLLIPILGQEKLNVFMRLDLLVLKPADAAEEKN